MKRLNIILSIFFLPMSSYIFPMEQPWYNRALMFIGLRNTPEQANQKAIALIKKNSFFSFLFKTTATKELLDLINEGASPDLPDEQGYTALVASIIWDDAYNAVTLINANASVNTICAASKTCALNEAVCGNMMELAGLILQKGAEPNIVAGSNDYLGKSSPLNNAAVKNFANMVELLLKNGADPNFQDFKGRSALVAALSNQYAPANREIVNMILAAGVNPDSRTKDGKTALMVAIDKCSIHIKEPACYPAVKQLLEGGADRFATDLNGKVALDYAKAKKLDSIAKLLEEKQKIA